MTRAGAAEPPSTRALVANQTIGLLAIVALVIALVGSERIQALVSRSGMTSYVAAWVTSRLTSFRLVDIWVIPATIALMIAWTVGVQLVVGRGKTFSHAEWRPARRQVGVALYLISSTAFAEEAIFRGIVLPATAYYTGTLWGLAISSLLFGLVHFEKGRWGQFVAAGYGAILGGGLVVGSSLLACVLAHAAGNALAFFLPGNLVGAEDSVDGS